MSLSPQEDTDQALPKGPYAVARHLSLDVVAGAMGGGYMAMKLFGSKLPMSWLPVLGMSVWLVYTLDHLLDVRKGRKGTVPQTGRHLFHRRWFAPLAVAWIVVLLADVALAFFTLPSGVLMVGALVGAMALIHLTLVVTVGSSTSPGLTKEVGVALVYAAGIWFVPWTHGTTEGGFGFWQSVTQLPVPLEQAKSAGSDNWKYLMVAQHFLLALTNVLVLSLFERGKDKAAGQTSMVQWAGEKGTVRLIQILLGIAMVLGGWVLTFPFTVTLIASQASLFLILMAHGQVLFFPELFGKRERYRAWADLSFCFTWIAALA